ncbi:MAG: hypothetical protein JWR44_3601 [Hymenobacter sp.]|jgi:hypothetical protein|nr:hypothetical protein [Hymenobacter sp.]
MKNWLTLATAAAFAVTALAACEKDEDQVTVAPSTSLTLSANSTAVVLTQPNSAQTALTYTWNPVTFALSGTASNKAPAVSYQLQLAKAADAFGYPAIIDAGTSTTKAVTVSELNTALTTLGLAPNVASPVYVRVVSIVGADNHSFASKPVLLTATPYKVCLPPNTDVWGLVGPAGDGWPANPPAAQSDRVLTWDCDARAYMLRTALNAGPFKFRKDKEWGTNLGGPTGNFAQGVTLSLNGPDMVIATAGTYTVKLEVTGSGTAVTGGKVTITP